MSSDYRFNRDEISKILKHAAELEHKDHIDDESEGLTLQELQQVSKEVGIDPKYIRLALDKLKTPEQSVTSKPLGGPFTYNFSDSAEALVTEEGWEEVVSEIRRIHGGIGKTNKRGNTFEWEQRKKEVGYVQISLSPKKDHTKININANYRYYASVVYILAGTMGLGFYMALLKNLDLPFATQILLTAVGMLGIFATARFYLSNWMKQKRKTYNKLFGRFKQMLSPASSMEHTPSITLPEEERHVIEEDEQPVQRQRNLRH